MVKYTIIIERGSLPRLVKLLLNNKLLETDIRTSRIHGKDELERRYLPGVLNLLAKKFGDILKFIITEDAKAWIHKEGVRIFEREGRFAEEARIIVEAKKGLERGIEKLIKNSIVADQLSVRPFYPKGGGQIVLRVSVGETVMGVSEMPEFNLEKDVQVFLANLIKVGTERSPQIAAKEIAQEIKEAIKPSAPLEPPKPPKPEAAHVSEEERIANRLQAEETYLFKETGRPDESFKIFAHAASRFGTGICYSSKNEDELKEIVKELRGKDIDFWWISSEFSQSKLRGGKYNVTSGNLGSPNEEKGVYAQIIKKVEAHKGTVILVQADWLLKAPVRPSSGEIMNFIKQLMRKIKGEKAVLILVFVISPALKEEERNLIGEIVNLLPKGSIIEV